ncbi:MAG: response regulator [Ardenticatenaceae bacterium]|nr:response regulator [Ardenticatenaceae bacterium]
MQSRDKKCILIVDDNVTNLKVAIETLKGYGLEILIARSGESGLERAVYAQPDLILLDVQMPGIDGFETCRRLKANEQTAEIPVIFMTALANIENKVRGFEAGGVDYVTKPIQVEEVWARVNTHLTIRDLQREKEERIQELDAFAHTVAHDLKNPLARIIGGLEFLEMMVGPSLSDDLKRIMQISMNGSRQMVDIIDELLLLASMRQEETPAEPVSMGGVVQGAVDRLSNLIEEYEAELKIPDQWPAALGYAPWLEEVWANYISNGLKYGGRPPRLELGADQTAEGMVRFWIKDNGEGLSEEDQAKLFNEFSRVKTQTKIKGHGLGLSIVGRIIRRLGGEVGVESEPDQGSTFFFTLSPTDQPVEPEPHRAEIEAAADQEMGQKFPLRILVADDNSTNQKLMLMSLARFGYEARTAGNGREVVERVKQSPFDLIFMDVDMPEMDGLEATRWLREHVEYRPLIIGFSALSGEKNRERCLAAGMDGLIGKPAETTDLAAILRRAGSGQTVSNLNLFNGQNSPDAADQDRFEETVVDPDTLKKLLRTVGENESNLHLITSSFLEDIPLLIEELKIALRKKSQPEAFRAAHSIKSLGKSFGALGLSQAGRQAEQLAEQGDLVGAADQLRPIERYFDLTKTVLSRMSVEEIIGT